MRKRRSEEAFRTKERSRDVTAKRKTRQVESRRKVERDMNSSRMRVTRQVTANRQMERMRNLSRMRVTRQVTANRQMERIKNLSRMRVTRQVAASRLVERSKNVSRMRTTRTNKTKRKLEQVKDTVRRQAVRKLPERKAAERNMPRIRDRVLKDNQPNQLLEARKKDAKKKANARKSDIFKKRESEALERYRNRIQTESLQTKLEKFRTQTKEGPTLVCICCGALWFRSSVHSVSSTNLEQKHNPDFLKNIFNVKSEDKWICRTCLIYVKRGQVPRLALSNGLDFPIIPEVLKNLTALEERLVALRLPFLQIRSLGVDRQCGMKGNVVHIPNDIETSVSCIPRTADEASVIPVVLVRQLDHQKPYLFQMVRPVKIYEAAKYLLTTPVYQAEGATLSLD